MELKEEINRLARLKLMQLNVGEEVKGLEEKYGKEITEKAIEVSGFYIILKEYL